MNSQERGEDVLLASEIGFCTLGFVVEIASVFDSDLISLLGPIDTVSLGDDLPGDAHDANTAAWIDRMIGVGSSEKGHRVDTDDEVGVNGEEFPEISEGKGGS